MLIDLKTAFAFVSTSPESSDEAGQAMQMIAMEIDYGLFERELRLPAEVDVNQVHAEQKNGFLWIHLPLGKS